MPKKDVPKNQRKSYHRGASDERDSFRSFIKRLEKQFTNCRDCVRFAHRSLKFIKKRVKRYRAIEGGL